MDQEKHFLSELIKNPNDESTRAVYADHLEMRGDPRGVWLNCEHKGFRPPGEASIEWLAQVDRFKPGEERINPKDGTILVWIPPGVYPMGGDMYADERPQHTVELTGCWIGKFPVTNEQYAQFVRETGHPTPSYWEDPRFNQPKQPVVGVSWHDAMAYCRWAGLRLPTEAEWEAAARGPDGRTYPWGEEEPNERLLNFAENVGSTTPVGSYPAGAGPFGTLDQAGNVWEWCLDTYDPKAYEKRGERTRDPVCLDPKAKQAASIEVVVGSRSAAALRFCASRPPTGVSLATSTLDSEEQADPKARSVSSAAAIGTTSTPRTCARPIAATTTRPTTTTTSGSVASEPADPKARTGSSAAAAGTSTSPRACAVRTATGTSPSPATTASGSVAPVELEPADPKESTVADIGTSTSATVSAVCYATNARLEAVIPISDSGEQVDPKARTVCSAAAVGTSTSPRSCAARTATGSTPATATATSGSVVEQADPKAQRAVCTAAVVGSTTAPRTSVARTASASTPAPAATTSGSEEQDDPKVEKAASNAAAAGSSSTPTSSVARSATGSRRVTASTTSAFAAQEQADPKAQALVELSDHPVGGQCDTGITVGSLSTISASELEQADPKAEKTASTAAAAGTAMAPRSSVPPIATGGRRATATTTWAFAAPEQADPKAGQPASTAVAAGTSTTPTTSVAQTAAGTRPRSASTSLAFAAPEQDDPKAVCSGAAVGKTPTPHSFARSTTPGLGLATDSTSKVSAVEHADPNLFCVTHGGSWYDSASYLRSVYRHRYNHRQSFNDLGFRCVD